MTTIWDTVGRFFGPSQNDRFAQLLMQLCDPTPSSFSPLASG